MSSLAVRKKRASLPPGPSQQRGHSCRAHCHRLQLLLLRGTWVWMRCWPRLRQGSLVTLPCPLHPQWCPVPLASPCTASPPNLDCIPECSDHLPGCMSPGRLHMPLLFPLPAKYKKYAHREAVGRILFSVKLTISLTYIINMKTITMKCGKY